MYSRVYFNHPHSNEWSFVATLKKVGTDELIVRGGRVVKSTLPTRSTTTPGQSLLREKAMFAPQGPLPSAPPAGMFDTVPGYEGTVAGVKVGSCSHLVLHTHHLHPSRRPPNQTGTSPPSQVLLQQRARHRGRDHQHPVLQHLQVSAGNLQRARSTEWDQQPFTGQQVDAGLQPAPGPWDISVQAPSLFQDGTQKVKVPYTSSTKPCHSCVGMGRNPCKSCSGAGSKVCTSCNGSGFLNGTQCIRCNGRGRDNCSSCKGTGSKECSTCKGKRQLLVFINLKVKWTNNMDEFVGDHSSGLPMEKLKSVSGKELFRDSQYMTLSWGSEAEPSPGAGGRDHQSRFAQTGRILQQRQTIQLIPISKVNYLWKGATYMYFVYGQESKVSADDYPATCCCCSVI
ncbi:hypothetical protein AAFF_G00298850 [Aldrovandia affinis]|uniref:Protein SSUH2 homolog n=1 Tax=Aldrovandia affinis TaxID=143900 RepID=A0AAD7R8S6_9TELE|nr:hypothetical protein AAFF_G00298850 [Aldrovandia affinis]